MGQPWRRGLYPELEWWLSLAKISPGPYTGGEGGIRTHDTLARIPVFETGPFNRSGTSPEARILADSQPQEAVARGKWDQRADSIAFKPPMYG